MVEAVEVEVVLLVVVLLLELVESLAQLLLEVLEGFIMVLQFQAAMVLQILVQAEVAVVPAMETAVMVQQAFLSLAFLLLKHRRFCQYNTALFSSTQAAISKSPPPII
jgi:hypothetical protein